MVIFHSYVTLPEGTLIVKLRKKAALAGVALALAKNRQAPRPLENLKLSS